MTAAFAAGMLIFLPMSVSAQEAAPAVPAEEGLTEEEQAETMGTRTEEAQDIIFVGDSRFVQMKNAAGENPYRWIARGSQGYEWFSREAVPQIDAAVQEGTKILINFGVNDVANEEAYAELVNRKAGEWEEKGAEVYYSSVNPVEDGRYVTEEKVEEFNQKLQEDLSPEVEWIDSFSWLVEDGYTLTDGLHFSKGTYQKLYAFYLDQMLEES
ncbi:MAG TPA: hypothetical protein H9717_07560 [Candidatus Eisenbergiella merdipullorum]|uniref:SGNH hydrolase-type esterase domain-containing protein n=1 Tax=Candidatus Eisenbergiella merdipullorum TaxID=2838553 RepID=A0A9D2I4V6_9FIRM|nr:hypothetical protein [Candidatus Eisenbergiella merdipullorum]